MGKQPTVWRVNFLCVFFSVDLTFWSIIGIVHWWCFQCEDPIILMNNTCQICFMSKYFPSVFWLSYVSVRRISGGRRIWAKIGSRWKCSDRSQQRFCHHSENCIYPRSNQLAGKMMMDWGGRERFTRSIFQWRQNDVCLSVKNIATQSHGKYWRFSKDKAGCEETVKSATQRSISAQFRSSRGGAGWGRWGVRR